MYYYKREGNSKCVLYMEVFLLLCLILECPLSEVPLYTVLKTDHFSWYKNI